MEYGVQKTKNLTIRYTRERKKIDIIQLPLFLSSTLHNSNGTTQCAKTNFVVATLTSEMDIQKATNNVWSTEYRRTTW